MDHYSKSVEQLPRVSVIIPVRNERDYIGRCLDSILAQDYANIAEILVIDGMSTDGTREIVRQYALTDSRIQMIDNLKQIVTAALNLGFQKATGDVIVRMDAHAIYADDYVSKCVHYLRETGAGVVGGPARPVCEDSLSGKIIAALHKSPFGIGVASFRRQDVDGYVDTVWNGAFWAAALDEAGRYVREELTRSEDIDLNSRIRAAGYRVFLTPKIRAWYYPRSSLWEVLKQNFGNGCGVVQSLATRAGGVRLRHLVPGVCVATLLLLPVLSIAWPGVLWVLASLLAIYSFLLVVHSVLSIVQYGAAVGLLMPVVFASLHICYGLGSLWGLTSILGKIVR
ncbi:MAG: glycosyltransferase family 2 protein, partial [Armatimonadetes bacterium]|nr:glycosyltransferase family 2 protein [Armatimonadota bacterium]